MRGLICGTLEMRVLCWVRAEMRLSMLMRVVAIGADLDAISEEISLRAWRSREAVVMVDKVAVMFVMECLCW